MIALLGDAGRLLLHALLVGAPLVAWQWVVLSARAGRGTFGLLDPTLIAGAMIGFAGLVTVVPPGALGFDAVLAAGGVWDLSTSGFLHRAAAMAGRSVPAMLDLLRDGAPGDQLRMWLSLAGALWLLHVAAGLVRSGPAHALGFLVAEAATFVAAVYGTIYAGLLLVWLFNQLNVWTLLLLILLIEDMRHNEPPWVAQLAAATGSFALRPWRWRVPPERTTIVP